MKSRSMCSGGREACGAEPVAGEVAAVDEVTLGEAALGGAAGEVRLGELRLGELRRGAAASEAALGDASAGALAAATGGAGVASGAEKLDAAAATGARVGFVASGVVAADLGGRGGSPARRIFSGSTSSYAGACAGCGGPADGACARPPARGSSSASVSRGASTGRSAKAYPEDFPELLRSRERISGDSSPVASGLKGGSGRDLGSIMYECDLRQSRRRSCNERAAKPTCRLTDQ